MDLHDAIVARRTIHKFNHRKVSDEIIERAIHFANYAPCHYLTFPWRFTSIKPENRKNLVEIALRIKFSGASIEKNVKDSITEKLLNPSHLLVVSQVLTNDPKIRLEDYAACACAIQNLMLSLAADGVGTKWSTGKLTNDKSTYVIANINPDIEEIIGFIWIGYGERPLEIKRPLTTSIFRKQ